VSYRRFVVCNLHLSSPHHPQPHCIVIMSVGSIKKVNIFAGYHPPHNSLSTSNININSAAQRVIFYFNKAAMFFRNYKVLLFFYVSCCQSLSSVDSVVVDQCADWFVWWTFDIRIICIAEFIIVSSCELCQWQYLTLYY